jgi:hypothetical protein
LPDDEQQSAPPQEAKPQRPQPDDQLQKAIDVLKNRQNKG